VGNQYLASNGGYRGLGGEGPGKIRHVTNNSGSSGSGGRVSPESQALPYSALPKHTVPLTGSAYGQSSPAPYAASITVLISSSV